MGLGRLSDEEMQAEGMMEGDYADWMFWGG